MIELALSAFVTLFVVLDPPGMGPIFAALGMDGSFDHDRIQANMDARCDATEAAEAQREAEPLISRPTQYRDRLVLRRHGAGL